MLINDHFHSRCSFDAEYPLTELCGAARAAGVAALCLTDHCDLIDEYGHPDDGFSWADEERELAEARERFPELDLRMGVELGQAMVRPEAARRVLDHPGIDFVLGSMHNSLTGEDFYWMKFTDPAQCGALLEEYLQVLLRLTGTDFFDSLAHLTYPLRYMRVRDGVDCSMKPFEDLIRAIFRNLIEGGKALELNTSGWRQGMGGPLPDAGYLRMYREMGGELITIGSDAHEPGHMDDGLRRGLEMMDACGFRYVTRFRSRKPEPIKLEELI